MQKRPLQIEIVTFLLVLIAITNAAAVAETVATVGVVVCLVGTKFYCRCNVPAKINKTRQAIYYPFRYEFNFTS